MDTENISHYRLLEKLGSGGMGVVFAAEDVKLGRKVGLKFLSIEYSNDPISLRRFEREARAASALNHPNICTIYEIDEADGHHFIAMELLKGVTLDHRILAEGMGRDELLDTAIQAANGLEAAHREGIIHRDIKPANIFLTTNGYVKLLDFGLAKLSPEGRSTADTMAMTAVNTAASFGNLTLAGIPLGTMNYMSPEQAKGDKLDLRTDIFSFGAVLYEMATGRMAFNGNTSVTAAAPPQPVAATAVALAPAPTPVTERTARPAPDAKALSERETAPPTKVEPPRARRKKNPIVIIIVMTMVLAAVGLGWCLMPGKPKEAYVNIQSNPAAQVFIDDKTAGSVAPDETLRVKVTPGPHRVRVSLDGYEAKTQDITVRPDETLLVPAELAAVTSPPVPGTSQPTTIVGNLSVSTNIDGVEVFIDGKLKGLTGRDKKFETPLNEGQYRIQAKKQGYDDSPEQRVEIWANKKEQQITLALSKAAGPAVPPPTNAYLNIQSKPGASVRVDGVQEEPVGPNGTRLVKVSPGNHRVDVNLQNFEAWSGSVSVKAGDQRPVSATLTAKAATPPVTQPPPPAPEIASFSASQQTIEQGRSSKLSWATQNGTDVSIEPGIGAVSPSGEREVRPSETTTYTLTAKGSGGTKTATALVAVSAPLPTTPSKEGGPSGTSVASADVDGVREALNKFKDIYEGMVAEDLRSVWPSVTKKQIDAIKAANAGAQVLKLTENCAGSPKISGDAAEWICSETMTYVRGGKRQSPTTSTIFFTFEKTGGKCYIRGRHG